MFVSVHFPEKGIQELCEGPSGIEKIGVSSVLLRKIIGTLEVGCGIVLTLVPGRPKDVANFIRLRSC